MLKVFFDRLLSAPKFEKGSNMVLTRLLPLAVFSALFAGPGGSSSRGMRGGSQDHLALGAWFLGFFLSLGSLLFVQGVGLALRVFEAVVEVIRGRRIQNETRLGREKREAVVMRCADSIRLMALTVVACFIFPIVALIATIYALWDVIKTSETSIAIGALFGLNMGSPSGSAGTNTSAYLGPSKNGFALKRPAPPRKPNKGDRFEVVDEGPHFKRTARGSLMPVPVQ
jgi:hypothetical protein